MQWWRGEKSEDTSPDLDLAEMNIPTLPIPMPRPPYREPDPLRDAMVLQNVIQLDGQVPKWAIPINPVMQSVQKTSP